MLKYLLRPGYRFVHYLLSRPPLNALLFGTSSNGKKILKGHISDEHLAKPELDRELIDSLDQAGIKTGPFIISIEAYKSYVSSAKYPSNYYGGGPSQEGNFTEKTLEHFVSLEFTELNSNSTFIDVAAATSPFYQIVRSKYGMSSSYRQDLIYPNGINGNMIGGSAENLYLDDNSVDAITLHCSLEHFEGDSDTGLFVEFQRVLKPGGKAVILPFYLAYEYTNHIDPAFNLLRRHRADTDQKAQLRYCDWYQYFSRHYDVAALKERILDHVPGLQLTVYRVENFREVDPDCYLRFVGVFEKRAE